MTKTQGSPHGQNIHSPQTSKLTVTITQPSNQPLKQRHQFQRIYNFALGLITGFLYLIVLWWLAS